MRIGVPSESMVGERRVALAPDVVGRLAGGSVEVVVQRGAGAGALIPDDAYADAGAALVDGAEDALGADVVVKVAAPSADKIAGLRSEITAEIQAL